MKQRYIVCVYYKNDDYHCQSYDTLKAAKISFAMYMKYSNRKIGWISITIHAPNY